MPALTKLSQATSKALGKEGRLLVRWSGTESKLRIMLEGPNLTKLTTLAEELANAAILDAGGA
jgi:phosphoglucosamine mutase